MLFLCTSYVDIPTMFKTIVYLCKLLQVIDRRTLVYLWMKEQIQFSKLPNEMKTVNSLNLFKTKIYQYCKINFVKMELSKKKVNNNNNNIGILKCVMKSLILPL